MFFETTICYFICEVIVGGWLASVGLEQGKRASTCRPRDAGSRWNNFLFKQFSRVFANFGRSVESDN